MYISCSSFIISLFSQSGKGLSVMAPLNLKLSTQTLFHWKTTRKQKRWDTCAFFLGGGWKGSDGRYLVFCFCCLSWEFVHIFNAIRPSIWNQNLLLETPTVEIVLFNLADFRVVNKVWPDVFLVHNMTDFSGNTGRFSFNQKFLNFWDGGRWHGNFLGKFFVKSESCRIFWNSRVSAENSRRKIKWNGNSGSKFLKVWVYLAKLNSFYYIRHWKMPEIQSKMAWSNGMCPLKVLKCR